MRSLSAFNTDSLLLEQQSPAAVLYLSNVNVLDVLSLPWPSSWPDRVRRRAGGRLAKKTSILAISWLPFFDFLVTRTYLYMYVPIWPIYPFPHCLTHMNTHVWGVRIDCGYIFCSVRFGSVRLFSLLSLFIITNTFIFIYIRIKQRKRKNNKTTKAKTAACLFFACYFNSLNTILANFITAQSDGRLAGQSIGRTVILVLHCSSVRSLKCFLLL